MQKDYEISRQAKLQPLADVASQFGILEQELEYYGRHRAKLGDGILPRLQQAPLGKYIVVTGITPTPLGEGKTVTTIGAALGLNAIGRSAICCIRQPSMGPVFGLKGGAAGGGYSQVVPMEDFNLHLTGDIHAVSAAHNLLAAFLDASLYHGNLLDIAAETITWKRVVDMNDRALRDIEVSLGGKRNGQPRRSGFDITAASEIMAILALCDDIHDLRKRLGRIVIACDRSGNPVTAEDLKVAGAMTAILKEAVKPTLMQTLEGSPCFIHTGPFANIATGNSSVIADRIALRLADYVVTEAGFGAEMGAEKFFNIKCRASGLQPSAAVLVATVRGLKAHSGRYAIRAGRPLPQDILDEDVQALSIGACNMIKQIENVSKHGVPVVVAINRMETDSDAEIDKVKEVALAHGACAAVVSDVFQKGGEGGKQLAEAIVDAAAAKNTFHHLYDLSLSIRDKIEILTHEMYGADRVAYSQKAQQDLDFIADKGWGAWPVCMAKTQYSLSHDSKQIGAPKGYEFTVTEVRAAAGAGFIYPLAGSINTMPGLGSKPRGQEVDIDSSGNIIGLF